MDSKRRRIAIVVVAMLALGWAGVWLSHSFFDPGPNRVIRAMGGKVHYSIQQYGQPRSWIENTACRIFGTERVSPVVAIDLSAEGQLFGCNDYIVHMVDPPPYATGSVRISSQAEFTARELQAVLQFPGLRHLALEGRNIPDDHVRRIAGIPSLRSLSLRHSDFDDRRLKLLRAATSLEYLDLHGTQVSFEEALAFARANPRCTVVDPAGMQPLFDRALQQHQP